MMMMMMMMMKEEEEKEEKEKEKKEKKEKKKKSSVPARNRNYLFAVKTLIELSRLTCIFSIYDPNKFPVPQRLSSPVLSFASRYIIFCLKQLVFVWGYLPARAKIVVSLLAYLCCLR
jgi:hypothetical protein